MSANTDNPAPAPAVAERPVGYFSQAWLVLLIALVFGGALAAVQVNLGEVIAANRARETLARIPALVPLPIDAGVQESDPSEVAVTPGTLTSPAGGEIGAYGLFKVQRAGRVAGWVVKAGGPGYAGPIEILLGLDPVGERITGLFVLEQKETPGLGNKITGDDWRAQFNGKATRTPLVVQKSSGGGGQGIDALSGATISSRSVTEIVNRVTADLRGRLDPAAFTPLERRQP